MGKLTEAAYGVLPDQRVVIEMAAASGLPLVPAKKRNPLFASSWGTGQLILDALQAGYRDITLGLGGSATNDGGMGAMAALGVRFLDEQGRVLSGRGEDLLKVRKIDDRGLPDSVKEARILQETYQNTIGQMPGGGAAGGLGAACMVFLQAGFQSGIEALLQMTDFDRHLEGTDLVITGEGRADFQSADGKVLFGIGTSAMHRRESMIVSPFCPLVNYSS